ncbi:MAG: folate-binding protein YgfZ [Glaciimonas sp.]|nr:folate-binding protein YgfZ [Glaciimonas sp.]
MNNWLQYLAAQGAHVSNGNPPEILHFGQPAAPATLETGFVAPLADLGVIAVSGEDAAGFLHNQLTNDVAHLDADAVRLAGYCTPKGRLLATFLMWKPAETILLQLPRSLQPAIQKRLQMYVMRAKVTLTDLNDSHVLLGLGGRAASTALNAWFPALPAAPYASVSNDAGTLLRLADAFNAPRYQWFASTAVAQDAWPALATQLAAVGSSAWRWSSILAGVPQITPPTQEQFVPQMLNMELIGGVNFKKGCYPGQEIVARMQYLGKLKRRMLAAGVNSPAMTVTAGMEVFSSSDPLQPCGMIVNAERSTGDSFDCLVEIKIAAAAASTIHLGTAEGPALQFRTLPYALPNDPE